MVFKKKNSELDSVNKPKSDKPSLLQELQTLDVKNFGDWSKPVQIISWGFIAFAVAGFGFLAFISPLQESITSASSERTILIDELKKKRGDVSGLEQYKLQSEEMERRFNQQLQQLPKESEIPGLVEDIHRAGVTSGLTLQDLELQDEVPKEFFIEQPIAITANGQFHNFGKFVQAVSALPRIVTVQDFGITIEDQAGVNTPYKVPNLKYGINAKTCRYVESVPQSAEPAVTEQQAGS